jgi:hypothetical protein
VICNRLTNDRRVADDTFDEVGLRSGGFNCLKQVIEESVRIPAVKIVNLDEGIEPGGNFCPLYVSCKEPFFSVQSQKVEYHFRRDWYPDCMLVRREVGSHFGIIICISHSF